jgi:hypothetical protein
MVLVSLVFIDLPISALFDGLPPIVIFGVFGTLWWYFLATEHFLLDLPNEPQRPG